MGKSALQIHLDTDFGGDIDDLCALAMLLRWPADIHLTGVTTVAELKGRRAGQMKYVLDLEGRNEVPVAAGADNAQGFYPYQLGLPPEDRYWPNVLAWFRAQGSGWQTRMNEVLKAYWKAMAKAA